MNYFINIGGLKPDHKVLDIGCGIGRMAIPLTGYLSKQGEYSGFDIVPKGIYWCNQNISTKFPNFQFTLTDIYNKSYNPSGKLSAATFKFPYPDEYFDFAFATSIFTHLLPEDSVNYLAEACRVLKQGGVLFSTWFIFKDKNKIDSKELSFDSEIPCDDYICLVINPKLPEAAIAYDHRFISKYSSKLMLKIVNIQPGSWDGKQEYLSYQDVVIFRKEI